MPSRATPAPTPAPALAPALASALGAALLAGLWSAALLGPAALVAWAAWTLLDFGSGASLWPGLSGLGATVLALERIAGRPGLWRGM